MRSARGEAVIVGVGIGAAVLIIRALIGHEPIAIQLLAVFFAGLILGGFQLALGRRRRPRRRWPAPDPPVPRPEDAPRQPPPAAPLDDRSPAWTGLAAPLPAAPDPQAPAGGSAPALAEQPAE
ncbi:MAG TPA: hypothetical protein VNL77_24675 [Roseiflexaceae bacterium]|nr:hypothetical protein [Roseiflexaceae bacterium]